MSGPSAPSSTSESDDKIRVLIVDDIPETRENLKKLLLFEQDIEVIDAATNGEEGIELAAKLQPDVVLMDINMPGVDGIQASEIIMQRSPYTQIIIMSVQGEADYLRRSMLAGAREFLIKPFNSNELVTSVRRVYQLGVQHRSRMGPISAQPGGVGTSPAVAEEQGKIIAIFSPKGGVGCSTLAINLAIALQKGASARVGVVDASLQFGDVAVLLNLQAPRTIADLGQIDDIETDLIQTVMASHSSGVKVLLAPPSPEMADLVPASSLTQILSKMRRMFDVIIVDMYSTLEDKVISILDEADIIVLVTTPEIPAIKSTRLFFEVTEALEYPPAKTKLILNKATPTSGIRAADIEASIKHKVVAQIPLDEKVVTTAVNQGVPFVLSGNTPIGQSIVALAKMLYQALQPKQ
jgi:pilus assembly protein CpaE